MNKLKSLVVSPWLLLIIVIIIAAFLRLDNIIQTPPSLYPDEAMNGNNALEALSTGQFKVFYPENTGREGLFMNIQAVFLKYLLPLANGNPEPWMLRLVSAIFGILTVLGLYFLTKELFGHKIALLSSFFLAVSFWHINFSRIGFRAIMAPFFAVWAIYFLLKALRSQKYVLSSVIGGIFFGLGFYSYIAFRALPLLIIIIWILYWIQNKDWAIRKKILLVACLFTLVALTVFSPLGIYFLKNPADFFGRTSQLSITSSATPLKDLGANIIKTAGMFNFVGDWNWRHNFAGQPELFWPVGILFLMGIFWGLGIFLAKIFPRPNSQRSFPEDYPQSFIILFSWLIIAALPVVISDEGIPHALRSILLIPPAFILAGIGGIWLYEFIKSRIKSNSLFVFHVSCLLILSLLIFQAYYTYFVLWANNPNVLDAFSTDYAWIAQGLNALPQNMPKYVVVEASGIDVRGIPMPAQTVMYITDTFTPEKQQAKNIHYVLPDQTGQIPKGSYVVTLK